MGDSAGGNLAAVVALCGRDGAVPAPVAQGLVYPALDARLDSPSIHEFADGFFLTRAGMEAYRGHYVPDPAVWETWRASPVLVEDKRGVAPALVVTAGFDPLRDEGATYARISGPPAWTSSTAATTTWSTGSSAWAWCPTAWPWPPRSATPWGR